MRFYKVVGTIPDEQWTEANNDVRVRQKHFRQIGRKSRAYNRECPNGIYCFLSEIEDTDMTAGMLVTERCDVDRCIRAFFRSVGIPVTDLEISETIFFEFRDLLRSADRYDFIEDDEEVLKRFHLDELCDRYGHGLEFGENLLDEASPKERLYTAARGLFSCETLVPELDRIYCGRKQSGAIGHPVHYMILTDNRESRKALTRTLLQALLNNQRLQNRRYCYLDLKPGEKLPSFVYGQLYQSCIGGAVIVRYLAQDDSDDRENNCVTGDTEIIRTLCETTRKYRNQVLTVFCLPRVCEKTKTVFCENLGDIGLVEIKEDLSGFDRSCEYLKLLAKKQRIRTDKALFARLDSDRLYYPDDLRSIFDEWYDRKMKTSVYPQYQSIAVCRKTSVKESAKGTAVSELNKMIGLTAAKQVITKAVNYFRLQRIYRDKGVRESRPSMHMVFTGNPGTAKTTVARLFARIMKENGLLSKGHLVEVGRGDLVAKYVGWTAKTVQDKFKEAMGGVLFIDEAYSLAAEHTGSFGDEAINTIVQEMENHREDVVVIFAGYPDEMDAFLNRNPGLRSRIAFHVPFADYTDAELCDIARLMSQAKGITLTQGALTKLSAVFDDARKRPDFGNGRFVRNILELSGMNQANRILAMDPDKVTDSTLTTMDEEDIEIPRVPPNVKQNRIGFAS